MNSNIIIIQEHNPKIIKEKIWCLPILNFKAKVQNKEDVIVIIQHNLRVDVGDKEAIFGIKLERIINSIKSKKEAKNINKYILYLL